ncbi:MAG: MarR family winged helix-turn-helix transcriptional regulator [Dongiaceae bacterium]|jgi:MarR family transcriptional regulator for hemolysin
MPQKQTPQQSLGFILSDVARMWRRAFNRRAYDLGLTQAQWQALAHISLNQGMRQAQLADILEVQPISVARLIDRMEAAGWICRKPDPDDRRAINLYPTQKAEPILSKMQAYAAEVRMFALEGVSEAEQQSLRQALMAIKKNLAEEEGKKET